MALRPEQYYQPPSIEDLSKFINKNTVPAVNPSRLAVRLMNGEERSILNTPTTGDMSLVLTYKNREGFVASVGDEGETLSILQFQGATRGEGYRVSSGVRVVRLFASQIHQIVSHPDGPYKELSMPDIQTIEGIDNAASQFVVPQYLSLATELGLRYSREERRYVKDTR